MIIMIHLVFSVLENCGARDKQGPCIDRADEKLQVSAFIDTFIGIIVDTRLFKSQRSQILCMNTNRVNLHM